MERLRQLFARTDDPYAGADIELARRMAVILSLLGAVLTVCLWPLSPLDREIGSAGWLIGAAIVLWGVMLAALIRSPRFKWTFEQFLVASYAGVVTISVMVWLGGGADAPYENLLLLPVLFVAATNPARRIVPLFGLIAISLAAPLVYNGWEGNDAASAIATFVLWSALALVIFVLMSGIRAQRLAMRQGEAQAREEARADGLTGIGNRRAFEEALGDEVARAQRMDVPLSVGMIDIENFKRINDEWGHLQGDQVLRAVAAAITSELRAPDTCFRWGGDEFALILPGTDEEGLPSLAERLQNKVAAACRAPDNEPVGVRFGSAVLDEGMSCRDLLEAADLALLGERARS
jgi:diguanylate cyclase (GGDEF)-like protein